MRNDIIELFTDIDDDLIAGAMPEAQRPVEMRADTRRFLWGKFAAAAACLAVVVVGGAFALKAVSGNGGLVSPGSITPSTTDTNVNSTIVSNTNIDSTGYVLKVDYNTQYIRTNGYIEGEEYPKTLWITNTTELSNYYQSNKEKYGLGSVKNPLADQTIGFIDAIEKYNDTFFETNDLILVVLEEGSGSIRHSVKEVSVTPSGLNHIEYCIQPTIERIVPENGTCDMAGWHIIIEISKEYGSTKCQLKQPLIMDKPEFNDNTSTQIEKIDCEDWTATKEFTMPEFPGDTFVWKKDEMLVSHGEETERLLYGASGIVSVYLTDLNGDGKRELVNLCWNGASGLSEGQLMVCDYANSKYYTLKTDKTMHITNELEIRDNVLYVLTYPILDFSKAISDEPLTFDMLEPITRCGLD